MPRVLAAANSSPPSTPMFSFPQVSVGARVERYNARVAPQRATPTINAIGMRFFITMEDIFRT